MHHRIADLDFRDLVSPACQLITNQSDAADVVARSINPRRLWLVVPRLVHDFPVASHWHQRVAWLQQLPRTSRRLAAADGLRDAGCDFAVLAANPFGITAHLQAGRAWRCHSFGEPLK